MIAAARDSASREDIRADLGHIRSIADEMIQALSAPPGDQDEDERMIDRALQRAEDRRSRPSSDPDPYFTADYEEADDKAAMSTR
jgi:hypothetical protein